MSTRAAKILLALCLLLSLLAGCVTQTPASTEPSSTDPTPPSSETSTQPSTEPTEDVAADPSGEEPQTSVDMALTVETITLTAKGETVKIYCGSLAVENISWLSEDESIAIFSQGHVIAVNQGTTRVYAQYLDQTVSCEVICDVDPDSPPGYPSSSLIHAPRLAPPVVEDMSDTSFFDDAAFIGDSVSYTLLLWDNYTNAFGDAVFLVRGAMGLDNTLQGQMKLNFKGKQMRPEEAVEAAGVKKIIVMMGTNDLGRFGLEGTMERWDMFLGRILEKSPDVEVYIQSVTPIWDGGQTEDFTNEMFDEYNVVLEAYCEENGYHFIDVAPYFKDYTNGMATVYCTDYFVHMNYDGAAAWERVLKAYAAEQKEGENTQ